jgi:hypothetical protein
MESENKKKNVVVETFAQDMAEVLKDDREGLVKKIIHGVEEEEAAKRNASPVSKQNKRFLATSVAFLVIGFGLLTYFALNQEVKTVPVEDQFIPFIFNDKISYVEVGGFKKDEIAHTVRNTINNTAVKPRGVEGVYPIVNSNFVNMREFFSLFKSTFAPPKEEIIVSDRFMMGIVNVGEAEASGETRPGFFMILKARSVPDIFPAMRAWEPEMFFDLHGFLGYKLSSDTAYLLNKDFTDGLVENKNARFLYDKDDNVVLMYIYADDTSVVITDSEEAVDELVLRLSSGEVTQ